MMKRTAAEPGTICLDQDPRLRSQGDGGRWTIEWRERIGTSKHGLLHRMERVSGAIAARQTALKVGAAAYNGEFLFARAGGEGVMTNRMRILSWDCRGSPEPDPSSLWYQENRRSSRILSLVARVRSAVEIAVGEGILSGADSLAVVNLAQALASR